MQRLPSLSSLPAGDDSKQSQKDELQKLLEALRNTRNPDLLRQAKVLETLVNWLYKIQTAKDDDLNGLKSKLSLEMKTLYNDYSAVTDFSLSYTMEQILDAELQVDEVRERAKKALKDLTTIMWADINRWAVPVAHPRYNGPSSFAGVEELP